MQFIAIGILNTYGRGYGIGFWAVSATVVLEAKLLVPRWCQHLYRREQAWARERELHGYPELLAVKPGFRERIAGTHRQIVVRLAFGGDPPAELDAIVRARGLTRCDDGRYAGPSPVTHTRARTGEPNGAVDHNRAVRRWVRRLDREVLAPLRAAHDLQGVVITL